MTLSRSNKQRPARTRSTSEKGKVMIRGLGPTLLTRGVPSTRYIKVNIESGAFVTGNTRRETADRFELMHPGAFGWMEKMPDLRL